MDVIENPYSTPEAPVDDPADEAAFADRIQSRVNRAWVAGAVSAIVSILFCAVMIAQGRERGPLFACDCLLVAGFVYGVYRKSRACAVALFVDSLTFKIWLLYMAASAPPGSSAPIIAAIMILVGCIFLYFYFQGILGAFAYRKHLKAAKV
jgi:hypothetical protein